MNKNFIVVFGTLMAHSTFAKMDFRYSVVIEILSLLVFSFGLKAYFECSSISCMEKTNKIDKSEHQK